MTKTDRLASEVAAFEAVIARLSPTSYGREPLQRLHAASKALRDMTNAAPPGETPTQAIKRLGAAAERFKSAVARTKQGLTVDEMGGIASLAEQRATALGMVADKYAVSIATAFAQADPKTRMQWLQQAAESGDGRTLAALAEAPAYVSGVDSGMLDRFLDFAEARHAPDLAAKRQQFEQDSAAVRHALQAAATIADRASSQQELSDLASAEKLAAAAAAALEAATE